MIIVAVTVATGLLVTGAMAQHDEHHPDQAAPTDKAATGKMGGMMAHENMMSQMMTEQNETGKLVDRLMTSLTAIEQEKNSTARKRKLAEHGALLKEFQTKVQAQSKMMDMMQHMMGSGTMNGKMMDDKKTMGDDHK
jgi:hypothetical protein